MIAPPLAGGAMLGGRVKAGALDPRTVPALMAGAIYLPGLGRTVQSAGSPTYYYQESQATQSNKLKTLINGAFNPPQPATAGNGADIWNFPGPAGSFTLDTPGTAYTWAKLGSYALWLKAASTFTGIRYLLQHWPADGDNNRVLAYANTAITGGQPSQRVAVFGCPTGVGNDLAVDPNDRRWKDNTPEVIDWTQWNFVRVSFDFDGGINFTSGGGNFSTKCTIWVNEVSIGDAFSAPQAPQANPPGGPCFGGQIFPNSAPCYWLADGISSCWVGDVGPMYVANGAVSNAEWKRIMKFNQPADA